MPVRLTARLILKRPNSWVRNSLRPFVHGEDLPSGGSFFLSESLQSPADFVLRPQVVTSVFWRHSSVGPNLLKPSSSWCLLLQAPLSQDSGLAQQLSHGLYVLPGSAVLQQLCEHKGLRWNRARCKRRRFPDQTTGFASV